MCVSCETQVFVRSQEPFPDCLDVAVDLNLRQFTNAFGNPRASSFVACLLQYAILPHIFLAILDYMEEKREISQMGWYYLVKLRKQMA